MEDKIRLDLGWRVMESMYRFQGDQGDPILLSGTRQLGLRMYGEHSRVELVLEGLEMDLDRLELGLRLERGGRYEL